MRSRGTWIPIIAVVLLLAGAVAVIVLAASEPPWENPALPGVNKRLAELSGPELDAEEQRQRILSLELENRDQASLWELALSYMPFLTAMTAAAGLFAAVWKQIDERSRQQRLDLEQRELQGQREHNANFTSVVRDLGSSSRGLQASAAVSLETFLRPEYKSYRGQVAMVVVANLKIRHHESVNDLLVRLYEQVMRSHLESARPAVREYLLDVSRTKLDRIDLSGLSLVGIDLAYASLKGANLRGASLHRARGIEVDLERARLSGEETDLSEARLRGARCRGTYFHDANLVAARFEEAHLQHAQFQRARLQSAHLDRAMLQGTRFEAANLNDAYFRGSIFDDQSLESITKAYHWREAHFDGDVRIRLSAFSRGDR